jgi:hypothetical protein
LKMKVDPSSHRHMLKFFHFGNVCAIHRSLFYLKSHCSKLLVSTVVYCEEVLQRTIVWYLCLLNIKFK